MNVGGLHFAAGGRVLVSTAYWDEGRITLRDAGTGDPRRTLDGGRWAWRLPVFSCFTRTAMRERLS